MFRLALTVALLAVTAGYRCCLPDRYQVDMVGFSESCIGPTSVKLAGTFALDAHGARKMAVYTAVVTKSFSSRYKTIYDFANLVGYAMDVDASICHNFTIKPYQPQCTPDWPVMDKAYIGPPSARLNLIYLGYTNSSSTEFISIADHCVYVNYLGQIAEGQASQTTIEYRDFSDTVTDPSIFHIPDFCHPSRLSKLTNMNHSAMLTVNEGSPNVNHRFRELDNSYTNTTFVKDNTLFSFVLWLTAFN